MQVDLYNGCKMVFRLPFVKWFAVCYRTDHCLPVCLCVLSCLSVCDIGVLWPNSWMMKMKLGMEVGLSPGHIVLDGDPAPPQKGAQSPIFGPCPLWPNGWMD